MFPKENVFFPGEEKSCLRLACHLGQNQIWQVDKKRAGSLRCTVKCVGKSSLSCLFHYLFSLPVLGMSTDVSASSPRRGTCPSGLPHSSSQALSGEGTLAFNTCHLAGWLIHLYFSALTLSLFYR